MARRTTLALLVGFGGLVIVALTGSGGSGALLSLLSAVAVTAGTLLVRHLHEADAVVASAVYFLIGGAALAVIAMFTQGAPAIDWTPRFIGALAFLGLIATAAASLAWFVETQRCALAPLTAWMFMVPVFGLLLGVVFLAERPAGWTLVGIVLVLLSMGVALALIRFSQLARLLVVRPDAAPIRSHRSLPRHQGPTTWGASAVPFQHR